jgi:hypothetical protein
VSNEQTTQMTKPLPIELIEKIWKFFLPFSQNKLT